MALRPGDDFERDILDIIPERYDADADSHQARAGHRFRTTVTLILAVIVVGGIVAAGWRFMGAKPGGGAGIPVIKADERPIKLRPDDRGGMQVPNQDKLVYERMDGEGEAKTETLLPPPEQPQPPPKGGMVTPPKPMLAPPPLAQPVKPGEPAMPRPAAQAAVSATPLPPQPVMAKIPPSPKAAETVEPKAAEKVAPKPPVQVAAVAPPAVPAPAQATATRKPPASGDYLVQLGAVRSADAAETEFLRIQKANAEFLSGLKPDVVRVELGEKGVFWRVRAGPLSEQAARQLCLLQQFARLLKSAPAAEQQINRDEAEPVITVLGGEGDEAEDAHDSKHRGHHQAARFAQHEPQQGAQDLAAVEGIDGQDVEYEQTDIDLQESPQDVVSIRVGVGPAQRIRGIDKADEDRRQGHVDQRARGNAPQRGAGALGRVNIGHAAEGPQQDVVRGAAHLAAGHGMAKLMREHDGEERQVFQDIPEDGAVSAARALDFVDSDKKPGPMQGDFYAGQPEETDRILSYTRHG